MYDQIIIDIRAFNDKFYLKDYINIINEFNFNTCLLDVYDFFPRVNEIGCYLIIRINFKSLNKFTKKIKKYSKYINEVHVYNSPINKESFIENSRVIAYSNSNLNVNCGIVSKYWFTPSNFVFDLTKKYNNCLYGKISIDADGNIKNCPSMKESFGNIRDTNLAEALEKPGFKKYWNIKKDDITKCKDCEFRYICTDCRAYLEDPNDIYSAPLKCGYDPYTGKWEKWSKNPLKQKAIKYYGMEDLVREEE